MEFLKPPSSFFFLPYVTLGIFSITFMSQDTRESKRAPLQSKGNPLLDRPQGKPTLENPPLDFPSSHVLVTTLDVFSLLVRSPGQIW